MLYFASVRRKRTSCQRCDLGRKLNAGIPLREFPVLTFQKRAPSDCARTSEAARSGALSVPRPSSPWHCAQRSRKTLPPPPTICSVAESGFTCSACLAGAVHSGSFGRTWPTSTLIERIAKTQLHARVHRIITSLRAAIQRHSQDVLRRVRLRR